MFESNTASTGAAVLLLIISLSSFCFGMGVFNGKRVIAEECADYGKTKINGKWYECKPK